VSASDLPVVFDARVVTGSGGGPDKTILNTPRYLEPLGYRMLCGYLTPPGDPGYADIEAKAKRYNAPLVTIPDRGPWDVRILKTLLGVCRRERVSIWHGHDYKTNALGLLLARFHRMTLLTTVHGWVQKSTRLPLYYRIDRWCLPRYRRVYCVSEDLFNECQSIGVKPDRLMLLDNAIDVADYRRTQSVAEAKRANGFDPGTKLILAVGRLSEEKAFDELIRAVAAMADPDTRLVIVGEGHDRPRLESLIADLSLTNRVTLAGWRSDVRTLFEAADVFALSSHREGLPNVLLEALALEVPIVSTHVNGIPRLIQDDVNGRLVAPGDIAGLTRNISQLLTSKDVAARYCVAGRRIIEDRFSFQARVERLARDYDVLCGRGRP
jgi:glycosyltransferase involved in cell wall biosynthesis